MQTLDRDEVSTVVAASPKERLRARRRRHPHAGVQPGGDQLPAGWTARAGPAVGARFEAVNTSAAGKSWKNRPVVTVAEPGREFAFTRTEPLAGSIAWRYRFEPVERGTRVVESYEVQRPVTRLGWLVIEKVFRGGNRREVLRAGMRTTLERLRVAAEARATTTDGADR